jgi:hypothetical protein
MSRRRATSFRPFEHQIPKWYHHRNFKRLAIILLLLSLVWLYNFLFPPAVEVTKQGQLLKEFFDSQNVKMKLPKGETAYDRRFLANLIPRPVPLVPSGQTLLDRAVAKKLTNASKMRYVVLGNLQFCDILNGAVVDSFATIHPLGGSIREINPTVNELAQLVDSTAQKAYNYIFDIYGDVDSKVGLILQY